MKILIAEDDLVSRTLMEEMLTPYGTVLTATNGLETVDTFVEYLEKGEPFELICLDIMMPEMDGQEALKEIRRIEQEKGIGEAEAVKIIMTTALSDAKNIMQALVKGPCDGYLSKPIGPEKIEKMISEFGLTKE